MISPRMCTCPFARRRRRFLHSLDPLRTLAPTSVPSRSGRSEIEMLAGSTPSVPLPPPTALLVRAKKLGAVGADPSPFATLAPAVDEKAKKKVRHKQARK